MIVDAHFSPILELLLLVGDQVPDKLLRPLGRQPVEAIIYRPNSFLGITL